MSYLDKKYTNLISSRLKNFRWKSTDLANFSCPYCGDSTKVKTKARGYLFPLQGNLCYKCHNCSASVRFSSLLKKIDGDLYTQYLLEKMKDEGTLTKKEATPVNKEFKRRSCPDALTKNCVCVASLNMSHPCKDYIYKRKIPMKYHRFLYYADDFAKWAKSEFPEQEALPHDPRLIIPYFKRDGESLLGVQGRSLDPKNKMRYISLKYNPDDTFLFGLERVNFSKPVFVTEGPLDSLFLDNCVALATAGKRVDFNPKNTVYVYDNEPRNIQIKNYMTDAVSNGFSVVVWPKDIQEKDINDMVVKGGLTKERVRGIIDANTYSGLYATLKISEWSKV